MYVYYPTSQPKLNDLQNCAMIPVLADWYMVAEPDSERGRSWRGWLRYSRLSKSKSGGVHKARRQRSLKSYISGGLNPPKTPSNSGE